MPGTFTQLYIQLVFAVQGRQSLIHSSFKDELYKYITGIVQNNRHKMLAINGMPDHIHIFIGLKPYMAIADLVRDIKSNSSGFIKEKNFVKGQFRWQEGYGAFSYSHSHIDKVVKYVHNQEVHHNKKTFREEYTELLKKFKVEYNEQYLFEFMDDLYVAPSAL